MNNTKKLPTTGIKPAIESFFAISVCHFCNQSGCKGIIFIDYSYSIRASIYCVLSVHEMEYLVCLFQLFHLVQRFFWIFGDILLTCVI